MGVCLSAPRNQVKSNLTNSPEFNSACDSGFDHCLSLTQRAFQGVFPYQLPTASSHLHQTLTLTHPLIVKWVPSPPTRSQIDSAYLRVTTTRRRDDDEEDVIGLGEFKEWATEMFAEAVVSGASKEVMKRVPIGVVGIAGIGAVTRSGKDLVGAAIGVYALGVATAVYLSLSH